MLRGRRPWREELEIIDRTMRAISGVTDPEELVGVYWDGIGELLPIEDYVAISRRNVQPPFYQITRSSRFTEHLDPWKNKDRLPTMTGGILGEIAYANKPVMIDNLPARLGADDPARFYLEGFQSLVALPQYDNGEGLNVTAMLLPAGMEIDPAAIPMLHWQSGLFGRGTQNLVLKNQLADAWSKLDRELKTVGAIQRSLLPSQLPAIESLDIAAYYETSAQAGGDYYDFFPLPNGQWGLFIADVSGHGTPAAVLMAITHAIAHAQPGTHAPPQVLLKYLNDHLAESYARAGTFVTAFYAIFDPKTRSLTYSRAGHNPPRLVRGNQVLSLDKAGGLPLGILEDQSYPRTCLTLEPGDLLLLYTDGITEAMAPKQPGVARDLFSTERLDQVILGCTGCSANECIDRIQSTIADFTKGAAPMDDRTLIAIRCK
jgi:sigma-B regulation protein RsbU (phosphoserine phosphatase)